MRTALSDSVCAVGSLISLDVNLDFSIRVDCCVVLVYREQI